jgi:hypothetical protein
MDPIIHMSIILIPYGRSLKGSDTDDGKIVAICIISDNKVDGQGLQLWHQASSSRTMPGALFYSLLQNDSQVGKT